MSSETSSQPPISTEFEAATSLQAVLDGTTYASKPHKPGLAKFEGVDQVMTYGDRHPAMEALESQLPHVITVGSFTHAAKYEWDLGNQALLRALQDNLSCPLPTIPYKLMYGTLLDERGAMVEDMLFYITSDGKLVATANVGNRDVVYERFGQFAANGFTDHTQDRGILYVYGKSGRDFVMSALGVDLARLGWRDVRDVDIEGIPAVFSATTYTPFRTGGEIQFPIAKLAQVWDYLHRIGQQTEMTLAPCGLTGRDLARTLAGLPLGGADYGIPEYPVPPTAFGIRMKQADFFGKAEALDSTLKMVRILVPSSRYGGRINTGSLNDNLGRITSVAYLPDADALLARSKTFPHTNGHQDQVRQVIAGFPLTHIANEMYLPMTGNHLMVAVDAGTVQPGQEIAIPTGSSGRTVQGIVCENLRAWPRETATT